MTTTGDRTPLHPYWDSWEIVQTAMDACKPAAAAAAFHRAVGLMPIEVPAAEKDPSRMPTYWRELRGSPVSDYDRAKGLTTYFLYPLLSQEAFAYAAVREDKGSLEILDSFCGRYGAEEPEPCSTDYIRIVGTVREMVAANEVTDIKDVRRVFSPEDRVRLRAVWRAMRDAKLLIVESQGSKVFFHRSAPEPSPSASRPIPFRKGRPLAETVLLKRPEHLIGRSCSHPEERAPSFDSWPLAAPEETPVPRDSRRTRKSESVSVGNKTWLQGVTVNKRADGSRYVPTTVFNPDGSPGPTVNLDGYAAIHSNPQGDCGISIDRDSVVRIYTPDAEQVLALNLAATPEVRNTIRNFGDKYLRTSSAIRSVHASLTTERLVVSVINEVFVYSFDGNVIAAFRLDDERTSKVYGSVVISSSKPDWAYLVHLAADGHGVYVGAYSGLLLHLSFTGELIDSWVLPFVPRVLWESDETISGGYDSFFFRASRGSGDAECTFIDTGGVRQLLGSHVLMGTRTASGFFDLDRFEGRKIELPKPRTAAYIANGRLVMETAASRFRF